MVPTITHSEFIGEITSGNTDIVRFGQMATIVRLKWVGGDVSAENIEKSFCLELLNED